MSEIPIIYADCAASAPVLDCAKQAMITIANPNSSHSRGRAGREAIDWARDTIAECINADRPGQISFTPSATAACQGAVAALNITECSDLEHKAVRESVWFNRAFGVPNPNAYAHILANNETGARYDPTVMVYAGGSEVFTDATAAVGHVPVDVKKLGVSALAAGGHKFGAFPGIGFLYLKDGYEGLKDAPDPFFPGTVPVALVLGMAEALKYRVKNMSDSMQYLTEQRNNLAMGIMKIPGAEINTPFGASLPNILSVRFDGINARELLASLDALGVCASAGAACSSDTDEASSVLLASGLSEEQALSTIRLSFCEETKPDAFNFVLDALWRTVSKLRAQVV